MKKKKMLQLPHLQGIFNQFFSRLWHLLLPSQAIVAIKKFQSYLDNCNNHNLAHAAYFHPVRSHTNDVCLQTSERLN